MTATEETQAANTLKDTDPCHVCILGPSGIGKSPLASLFSLTGLDPLRVRLPRDEKDKKLCIAEPDAMDLFVREAPESQWPARTAEDDWFILGARWLFIGVRGDRQCLRFKEDDGRSILRTPKRVEIFAPRLLDILNPDKGAGQKIGLWPHNVVVLLLNPSAANYGTMAGVPNDELKQATFYAVTKRAELQGKPVDVPDALKRIRRLPEELQAWVEIKKLVGSSCIEYRDWKHFEFRYHQPDGSIEDARRELLSARDCVLKGLQEAKANGSVGATRLLKSDFIRSPEEILEMGDIV